MAGTPDATSISGSIKLPEHPDLSRNAAVDEIFSPNKNFDETECHVPEFDHDLLQPHSIWMHAALDMARQAFEEGEVPIGAVIVHNDRIIGAAGNQREQLKDPTAHAEIIAITQAAESLGSWRLLDCTLYATLEPCPMCAGAIVQARIPTVVYGTTDEKAGACHTLYQITSDPRLNHRATVIGGVLREECREILREFFAIQRSLGKK